MYGCMDLWMYGCMDVWTYGCMDVWMYGCMDVWMHACMHVCRYVCMYHTTILPAYKLRKATACLNIIQGYSLPMARLVWTQWLCAMSVWAVWSHWLYWIFQAPCLVCIPSLLSKKQCAQGSLKKPCCIAGELHLLFFVGHGIGKLVLWIRLKLMQII